MKQPGQTGRLATLRLLAHRFAFASLILASFALMLLGKADTVLMERTRVLVTDALTPVLDVISRPAGAIADVVNGVRDLANLRADNVRLQEENAKLMHWQVLASRLESENRALRAQMNFIPESDSAFITARVVADSGGAFVHSLVINAGSSQGVRKGQAVLSGEVLVGRVAEVGLRSARVLLLTDLNARIPVMLETSRAKAILSGDNSDRPKLGYLTGKAVVATGDRVVTSGHGGAFPPGLPVGVVASVSEGMARLEPFVHRHQLEYVTVVDYGLAGILSSPAAASAGERDPR